MKIAFVTISLAYLMYDLYELRVALCRCFLKERQASNDTLKSKHLGNPSKRGLGGIRRANFHCCKLNNWRCELLLEVRVGPSDR